jgi:uncharacterized protein YdeI (YjbR/CyaY-like superfamily)
MATPARKPKLATTQARTRQEWRDWLQQHHRTAAEVWLIFEKQHTGKPCVEYEDSIEEALCFGWVDSLVRRLDDDRFARKFTPRKPDSAWSAINRARYAKVEKAGLLTDAGRERPPGARSAIPPAKRAFPSTPAALPADIKKAFKANAAAWATFERLAPSHQRHYAGWILIAKRPETREKRIREAVALLAKGQKLGLK